MTISIGGLGPQPKTDFGEPNVDRVTSGSENKASRGADAGIFAETTTLLAGAANLAALTKIAMNGDESRTGRVEQLRQDIAAGAYKAEPTKIADSLLPEWQ